MKAMTRYTLITLAIFGTIATAVAAVEPSAPAVPRTLANTTVVAKNSPFPVLGQIIVETCIKEDCSEPGS
jgi:hypothetical protein